ncbi:hypothetical protein P3X46_003108 [Hevea brasiliensis]|uniref:Uncharacterized protein n=1 Tax=Hevea brasiliensis TaxID=3981 RepID=A0ABQ9N5X6_HEVBR|nr:uncharacterized protein LOC110665508 [Hevea brasiliensis]KAJ9187683.1 hypothetical protein P3X46_003108 [Hevea brasiliensis]
MDVYEKINKAVIVCSAIHAFRNKPGSLKHPKSAGASPDTPHKREAADDVVPISFDYSSQPQPATLLESAQKNTQITKVASKIKPEAPPANTDSPGQVAKSNSKVGSSQFAMQEGKRLHIEDNFTYYIDRVRARMRTISNVGDLSNVDNVSHVNVGNDASGRDEFSEYIDRARIKIRTTSNIGGGNFPAS